jgi:hypothetical protein
MSRAATPFRRAAAGELGGSGSQRYRSISLAASADGMPTPMRTAAAYNLCIAINGAQNLVAGIPR